MTDHKNTPGYIPLTHHEFSGNGRGDNGNGVSEGRRRERAGGDSRRHAGRPNGRERNYGGKGGSKRGGGRNFSARRGSRDRGGATHE